MANSSSRSTGSDIDMASFIDDFVSTWTREPTRPQTQSEISAVLATANRVKMAMLNPGSSSKTKASPQARAAYQPSHTSFNSTRGPSLASNTTLEQARSLVRHAQQEADERNKERIKNPRLNTYSDTKNKRSMLKERSDYANLFTVNSTIAAAAAMVAEADAAQSNMTVKDYSIPITIPQRQPQRRDMEKRAGTFWMENIVNGGQIPYGGADNNGYKVFRNVKDYGAVGDGLTDDSAAIKKAMTEGNRCGASCGASSVKGAVIYFPHESGNYLISSPIEMYYHTQMIGDANQHPILTAASSFIGLGVLSSDFYTGGAGGEDEWFINQNNFYRQVRNFVIDVRAASMVNVAGIHWQVAQATSIQDVSFFQSTAADKSHMGIFAENGSGGFMSDLTFIGGAIGIRCGNQQFTTRNFVFLNCKTAIDMLWDWGWTWKSLAIYGSDVGIKMSGDYKGGSILVLDSEIHGTKVGVSFSIVLDNLLLSSVDTLVDDQLSGIKEVGGTRKVESFTLGRVYDSQNPNGKFQSGGTLSSLRPKTASLTEGDNLYVERSKPQYGSYSPDDFINARISIVGDGYSDDTFGFNLILSLAAAANRPLYIPMGSYLVTDTINASIVPVGSRLVGQCWSQIVAQGANFADPLNPRVMVRVGQEGDTGVMEIQDLLFTTKGPTAGVILMEWNVAQEMPGSAAMWDSHFRIGGAKGTNLQAGDCPKLSGAVNKKCIAGTMLLHLTPTSSAYLENIWGWVADHDIDSNVAQTQIDIYVARGILIESQGPTWLYGTASEHCVLYQYQLFNARDIFLGMIQTESPYYLPTPQAPAPFPSQDLALFIGDPTFADCDRVAHPHCAVSWGLRVVNSKNVHIAGAGLYNWFQNYVQPCVDAQNCAQRVLEILRSSVWMNNLYTIGTEEMVYDASAVAPVLAKQNTNKNEHPFTSIINAWLLSTSSGDDDDDDDNLSNELPRATYPCTASFRNISQVLNSLYIPPDCLDRYLLEAEIATIQDSLDKYTKVISDGYDKKFQIYANHIKDLIPLQIKDYMSGAQASGFFTCTIKVPRICCSACGRCPDCDRSSPCTSGQTVTTVICPKDIPDPGTQAPAQAYAYTCTNVDGFKADLLKKYGIDPSWIEFGDYLARINGGCWMNPTPQCGPDTQTIWTGFPRPKASFSVPDPKDIISKSLENTRALAAQLEARQFWKSYSVEEAERSDLVDAASVPALMTSLAVQSMDKVVAAAKKITADERKEMILNFVMAIVLLIPGAGELADLAGVTALKTFINLAGDLGNVALGIYGAVEDPKSAIIALFGALLGGGGSSKSFQDAAVARRGLTEDNLKTLGPIRGDLDKMSNKRGLCWVK
ncbi:exo-1,3-beta-D-glucanase [Rhexocercosporidium sp. MPI-PUGE-AT-0058]|nr:exo-1,3-beta-D-glucanase [Rhexocercosporidium sp. MPI-PUGE-AT-0058]